MLSEHSDSDSDLLASQPGG